MKVLVTCGPAYEPIDSVRRITNHATGEIGTILSDALSRSGFDVTCFRGDLSTHARLPKWARVIPFTTNNDLTEKLRSQTDVIAVFHAAALCDFGVKVVQENAEKSDRMGKISSQATLHLDLRPLPKVIGMLRNLFPIAQLVGWKYEVEGIREEVITKAQIQIAHNQTQACVVNGPAFGTGFGFCTKEGLVQTFSNKEQLSEFLANWMR